MKPDEVDFVVEICRAAAGLKVDGDKVYLIESRLAPVARREGFASIREMLISARQRKEEKLLWSVVEAMAQGETCFFRGPEMFERLREEILPQLAVRRPTGAPIRIWSAGCASGQEAYSVAITVEDAGAGVLACGVDLMGSDLSERALEKAQSGLYTQFEIQRGLPIRHLARHFERRDEHWGLSPRLRAMVRWRRVNLNTELRGFADFDVILCRNVLANMTSEARERALGQLVQALAPGGYLIMGADEPSIEMPGGLTALEGGLHRLGQARVAA
ncbi:MAG TPA: protein-glutamate O-methyltransferase CheR [Caulobacteraceae bacterium]